MLKSEAEHFVRRAMEETGAQFTEEQVQALAYIVTKIAGRMVEEAIASYKPTGPSGPGGRSQYFSE